MSEKVENLKEEEVVEKVDNNGTESNQEDKKVDNISVVEELKKQNEELKDKLLRMQAEMENLRKRSLKELEDANKYAVTNFARDLIETLENLYRAVGAVDKENTVDVKSIYDGIVMTKDSMVKAFESHKITRVYPLNKGFDHNVHQAVAHVPSEDKDPGTVVDVIQAGYLLKDRLLRPALVAVAKESDK